MTESEKLQTALKFQTLGNRAVHEVSGRICPLCSEKGLTASLADYCEYFYKLAVQCTCGAVFHVLQCSSREDDSINFSCDTKTMTGWKNCSKCSLPYGPEEAILSGHYAKCPGCGDPDFGRPLNPSQRVAHAGVRQIINDGETVAPTAKPGQGGLEYCTDCGKRLKLEKYSSYTEYRDGMTGDYTRTTEKFLGYCQSCNLNYFISTLENTKFGGTNKVMEKSVMEEKMAQRIRRFFDTIQS
ncbi:MAG: hypothetical protein CVV64_20300 [Candidatus Wallbacteria bacterium HGW-Wallbacteria-1]|jgi:hypothetical protein|uniref:Uncharacterized protein n=1 Tax=Candidatus Wallbacteria bacterium HGW-Wallbacteria-1 TaxID=2013854 RepID=A0A2N1PIE8_9BACT|nr:MAG: hypothetical protein CVV64_20300 [Candidatus Wallbacteria bacterium HGW-Wallbacteria-1]